MVGRNLTNYYTLQIIRDHRRKMDPLELLRLTHDFVATYPEDKIFGLFALMSDADREALGPYTPLPEHVFRRFAALQVRQGRVAAMLDIAGLQRRLLEGPGFRFPSWVPDWTAQGTSSVTFSTLQPLRYEASGETRPVAELLGDDLDTGGLSVGGIIVDTIATVSHVHNAPLAYPGGPPDFLVIHDRFRAAFDELVRQGKSIYEDNESFAHLLLMDDLFGAGRAIQHSTPIFDPIITYWNALASFRQGNGLRGSLPGGR